jgi:hypothetical protein
VEYVWWFLIVGLVVGGALVAAISIDWSRRDEDIQGDEREAEATVLAAQLAAEGQPLERTAVAAVLQAHRDYRRLPPPDRLERLDDDATAAPPPADPAVSDDDTLAVLVRPPEPPAPPVTQG